MPLNPPASARAIAAAERAVDASFPASFRAFLLEHDGESASPPWLAGRHRLLPVHEIAREWEVWNELAAAGDFDDLNVDADHGVRSVWWHRRWIPFTTNGAGDSYCLDLAPASGGREGQIITLWHDDGARQIAAASFRAWQDAVRQR